MAGQEIQRLLVIASKEFRSDSSGGHYFGSRHLGLLIVSVIPEL
jgi:hypothetical protein